MDIQFVEPCCVSKQLPNLLKEHKVALFQTNGDVTFEQLLKAISSLAGDKLSIKLMVPTIDVDIMRVFAWYGRRGWLKELKILTHDNQVQLVRKELASLVPLLSCYHHGRVVESLLVIDGERGCVAVSGHFLSSVSPGHRFYMIVLGESDSDHVRMLTATANPLMRKEDIISTEEPALEAPITEETESTVTEEAGTEDAAVDIQETSAPVSKKSKKK